MFEEFSLVQRGEMTCAFCKESILDGEVIVINTTVDGVMFMTHPQCEEPKERRKAIKDKVKYKEKLDEIRN